RHTRFSRDWSSDVCSSDLKGELMEGALAIQSQARKATEETTPLRLDFDGAIVAPDGNRFDGVLRLKSRAQSFDLKPEFAGSWWRSEERRVGEESRAGSGHG